MAPMPLKPISEVLKDILYEKIYYKPSLSKKTIIDRKDLLVSIVINSIVIIVCIVFIVLFLIMANDTK